MREIKFRAYYLNEEEKQVHEKAYAEWSTGWEGCSLSYVLDNSDYAVVQYTGLKDKNGVAIYEGDVVEVAYFQAAYDETGGEHTSETTYRDSVEFFDGAFVTALSGNPLALGHGMAYPAGASMRSIEVIGNIYENPELLEAKS